MPDKNITHRLAPELAEALDADELRALDAKLEANDPAMLQALRSWTAGLDHITTELARAMPLRELLVHYALADTPSALTHEEAQRLSSKIEPIEEALQRHPSLQAELARIRADRDAFEELWESEATSTPDASRPASKRAADRPARAGRTRWLWRTAAVAAIVLFVVAASLVLRRDAGFVEVQAGLDETERLVLEDGSEILLAEAAVVGYRLDAVDRRVRLVAGEAVFEVQPDERPFVVETEAAVITVVGTTFGVSSEDGETHVTLANGAVDLASRFDPQLTVRLEAGQQSRVAPGAAPEAPSEANIYEALAWTGVWHFRAETLDRIATIIGDYHGIRIHVPESLANERVTGAFERDQDAAETLRTIASAFGATVGRDSDGSYRFVESGG